MANIELDINEIVSSFISDKLDAILDGGKNILKKTSNKISLLTKNKYKSYLTEISERYLKTRTFFIREPHFLYDFYIPAGIRYERKIIETAYIKNIININRFSIISGSGGAGKSILLKHLLIDTLKNKYKIPVFIELRDLNKNEKPIKDLIHQTLDDFNLSLDPDYFEESLKKGHYIILLDGLDEVTSKYRSKLVKDIDKFTKRYKECDIIITTRPDENTSGLTIFSYFNINPLDLEKSIELVKKLPAEKEIKEKFILDLNNGIFEKHISFLSNPLLLTIMLLTYGYSADIPNKLHIFYNQAYEALFQRHDTMKGAYKRNRETSLDISDFEKALSAFCAITYDLRQIRFTKLEALKYIEQSKSITGINFNANHFLLDLLQSVCFLVNDGLEISFAHRSFQEYFTAKFISSIDASLKLNLIERYWPNINSDNVFKLLYELDKNFMEKDILLPRLKSILAEIGCKKASNKPIFLKYLKHIYSSIEIEFDGDSEILARATISNIRDNYTVKFLLFTVEQYVPYSIKSSPSDYPLLKEGIYSTKKLSTKDHVVEYLYNSEAFISKVTIDKLINSYSTLSSKVATKDDSLESIFQKARK